MKVTEFIEAVMAQVPELARYEIDEIDQDKVTFFTLPLPDRGAMWIQAPLRLRAIIEDVDVDQLVETMVDDIRDTMKYALNR